MPAYMIIQIKITQTQGWSLYRNAVGPLMQRFGGRFLVAGGAKVQVLEGSHDGRSLVVSEFPSMDAIHRFWSSSEYAEVKKLREDLAELDVWAVPGVADAAAG